MTLAAAWVLKHATSPGIYVGAAILLLSAGGFLSKRLRYLALTFGAYAALCYLMTLRPVAHAISPLVLRVPLGEVLFAHQPYRFGIGVALALPLLGAVGFEAWAERGSIGRLVAIAGIGAALWFVIPLAVGVEPARLALPFWMGLAVVAALAAGTVRPILLAIVPAILAVDLVLNGSIGLSMARSGEAAASTHTVERSLISWVLGRPYDLDVERYTAARSFSTRIAGSSDRFATLATYHPALQAKDDASLADQRAIFLGLEDVNGYNPVQLLRYWRFVRAANLAGSQGVARRMKYNKSFFVDPTQATLDLMDVGWLVGRGAERAPSEGTVPVAEEGRWKLLRRPSPARAVLMGGWATVRSSEEALSAIVAPDFDPSVDLVLERDPETPNGAPGEIGEARFSWTSDSSARVEVDTPRDGVLLVRNAFDPGWEATIDGVPADVFPADYVLQGIEIPAGRHVVELRYVDPWIGFGVAGSVLAVSAFLGAAGLLEVRRRRLASETSDLPSHE